MITRNLKVFGFVVSLLLLMMAYNCYPVPDGDKVWLLPFSINFSQGKGFVSPFQVWINPEGKGLIYFFYYYLLGSFTRNVSFPTVLLLVGLLEIACVWLLIWVLCHEARSKGSLGKFEEVIIALISFAALTFIFNSGGRPDVFIFFLTLLTIFLFKIQPQSQHCLIGGICLSVAFVSHPLEAGLLGLTLPIYYGSIFEVKKAIRYSITAYLICLVFSLFLIQLYPDSVSELFSLLKMSANVVGADRSSENWTFMNTWILNTSKSFYGLLFFIGTLNLPFLIKQKKNPASSGFLTYLSSISIFIAFLYFGLYEGYRSNYVMAYFPFILISLCDLILIYAKPKNSRGKYKPLCFLLVSIILLGGSGFARETALFPYFIKYGMQYRKARQEFEKIRSNHKEILTISTALFSLTENYENINHPATCLIDSSSQVTIGSLFSELREVSALVVQQINIPFPDKTKPPKIQNFTLIENHFSPIQPKIAGLKIANSPRGYNYALYYSDAYLKKISK